MLHYLLIAGLATTTPIALPTVLRGLLVLASGKHPLKLNYRDRGFFIAGAAAVPWCGLLLFEVGQWVYYYDQHRGSNPKWVSVFGATFVALVPGGIGTVVLLMCTTQIFKITYELKMGEESKQ